MLLWKVIDISILVYQLILDDIVRVCVTRTMVYVTYLYIFLCVQQRMRVQNAKIIMGKTFIYIVCIVISDNHHQHHLYRWQ